MTLLDGRLPEADLLIAPLYESLVASRLLVLIPGGKTALLGRCRAVPGRGGAGSGGRDRGRAGSA